MPRFGREGFCIWHARSLFLRPRKPEFPRFALGPFPGGLLGTPGAPDRQGGRLGVHGFQPPVFLLDRVSHRVPFLQGLANLRRALLGQVFQLAGQGGLEDRQAAVLFSLGEDFKGHHNTPS